MIEYGRVVRVEGNRATVAFTGGPGCKGCALSCSARGSERLAEARNVARARVGDYVEVAIEDRVLLRGAALVYLFPLFAFLAGYEIGVAAGSALSLPTQVPGVIGAFVFLGLSFLGLRAAFTAGILSTHEFTPVIRAVVSRPEA